MQQDAKTFNHRRQNIMNSKTKMIRSPIDNQCLHGMVDVKIIIPSKVKLLVVITGL
jgi:hypothetical protein